jgi:peptidoglycan-N-acetylglucosamine deacetylase
MTNILTFDIEEWFHVLDNKETKTENDWEQFETRIHQNMDLIFNLLEKNNQKATFFCLGWVARKYPEVIKKIDSLGYEIATHSDLHQLAFEQTPQVFREDLNRSIKSLEDCIGKKIISYRAPGFSLSKSNKWVFEELINAGIQMDCSIFPAERAHGGFEDFGTAEPAWVEVNGMRLKEFPINLKTTFGKNLIFSGGGYFRLFPKFVLLNLWKTSPYVMTYFHPRDFDPTQPMIPGLNSIRKFKSYYGLKNTWSKLDAIISEFPFEDLRSADKKIDWNAAKVIYL